MSETSEIPSDDQSIFDKEVEELGTLIDVHNLIEDKPYSPNRAQRRAQAKRNRALQKRNLRSG